MPASASPTFTDQRWGRDRFALFDYWQHPTRDSGGNPLLLVRHGGAGLNGDHAGFRDDSLGHVFYFIWWLLNAARTTHFDVCSFTSAEYGHSWPNPLIPRSKRYTIMHAIEGCKLARASIKHLHHDYGFDPSRIVAWGDSYGAALQMTSTLTGPYVGRGGQRTRLRTRLTPETHDSTVLGVINHVGVIDARNDGSVDAIHFSQMRGWFGTRTDVSSEFDALDPHVRAAPSTLAYFENGDTQFYREFFNLSYHTGDHVKPYGDPGNLASDVHDSQQRITLNAAIAARGLPYGTAVYNAGDMKNDNYPSDPTAPRTVALYNALYAWMVAKVS